MTDSKAPSKIVGQLHEILSTHLTGSFILFWTLPLCRYPLWYRATGTDLIILSRHVKMRSLATGMTIVTVEPCGLIHRMEERLNHLWLKLTRKAKQVQQSSAWYPHELTRSGGGRVLYTTRRASLKDGLSLEIKETRHHFQAQL